MNVLVAHDGSALADKALEAGAKLAAAGGGSLTIVTVVPDLCLSTEELSEQECDVVAGSLAAEARGRMERVSKALEAASVKAGIVIKYGRPAESIVEAAAEAGAGLIVVGSQGKHGAAKLLLGSVSSRVAELAACNVLIVK
ncbi:universal stress protein [Fundidesulfovibrio agrisoli]|uniref:universal stress protein n=1 Tax=Fundidesulfovibrio agrisoli TaxID=2922717 RepID=UPI001FAE4E9D|nr:universal stress protein [Fundidesulfovibrio agrisoli]